MGLLIFPLMIVLIAVPGIPVSAGVLADFSRLQKAQNADVAVLDQTGIERIGRLMKATDTNVTLQFGSTTHTLERADVFSADRLRDSTKDGVVKGAIFGLLVGLIAMQGFDSSDQFPEAVVASMTVYGGVGYLLDRAHTSRAPLYRAPKLQPPTPVTVRLKF